MTDNVVNITPKKKSSTVKGIIGGVLMFAVIILALVIFNLCTFTVGEGESAVIREFGKITRIVVAPDNTFVDTHQYEPAMADIEIVKRKGLHFRMPFITNVEKFSSMLLTYVSSAETVHTADKKQYLITMYGEWRIAQPALFAVTQGSIHRANTNLDGLVYPAIIQNINKMTSDDFVSNKEILNEALEKGLASINEKVQESGIEMVDIQICRTILPQANLQSTYQLMVADRAKAAQVLRSEGDEEYRKKVSQADREARVTESEAIEQSERIKGEGEAQALEIYAKAYGVDAQFYTYWRSLQALENSLSQGSTIMLDQDNPLWSDMLGYIRQYEIGAE